MSLKFLLDTNILSEGKHPQPNSNVMAKLELNQGQIATATIVVCRLGRETKPNNH